MCDNCTCSGHYYDTWLRIGYLGLGSLIEPCTLIYEVENASLDEANASLKQLLPSALSDGSLVSKCREQRVRRLEILNESMDALVSPRWRPVWCLSILTLDLLIRRGTSWRLPSPQKHIGNMKLWRFVFFALLFVETDLQHLNIYASCSICRMTVIQPWCVVLLNH